MVKRTRRGRGGRRGGRGGEWIRGDGLLFLSFSLVFGVGEEVKGGRERFKRRGFGGGIHTPPIALYVGRNSPKSGSIDTH